MRILPCCTCSSIVCVVANVQLLLNPVYVVDVQLLLNPLFVADAHLLLNPVSVVDVKLLLNPVSVVNFRLLLLNPQLLCKDHLVVHLNTRCALHGLIYLWDLKSTTKSLTEDTKKDKIIEKEVKTFNSWKKSPSLKTNVPGDDALQLEVE